MLNPCHFLVTFILCTLWNVVFLHPSSLSFTGCLWNLVFNAGWWFWLSVFSRVLFLHVCLLFRLLVNHHVFFDHPLKNCSKFPGLTLSQPVKAHFILLPGLIGSHFQGAFVTSLISCNSRLIWKWICSVKLFLIHSFCVFYCSLCALNSSEDFAPYMYR